jgi:hypothetical protein
MRLVIAAALALTLLAGCAKHDMDECHRGDRSRCPGTASDLPREPGNGLLANTIGNRLETTIAVSHLIFEGTLDRFPGFKTPCAT